MKRPIKKVFNYHGFESTYDLERDMSELFYNKEFKDIPGEFQGTLRVTVEYIEEGSDD